MLTFKSPQIQAVLLRRHEPKDLRRQSFEFEALFKDYIKGEVEFAPGQVAGAPNAPKFQIRDDKRALIVADTVIQLTLDFQGMLPTGKSLSDILQNPMKLMQEVEKFFPDTDRHFHAIILQAALAYDGPAEDVARHIAKNFFLDDEKTTAITANYSVGAMDGAVSTNLEASMFSFFEMTFTAHPGIAPINLDPDFLKPVSQGLQLKLEANTKLSIDSNAGMGYGDLIPPLKKLAESDKVRALGFEVTI